MTGTTLLYRRTFLEGLVRLPLVGGSLALVGRPTAAAEPITLPLLDAYNQWLWGEHTRCGRELETRFGIADARFSHACNAGSAFHSKSDWSWNVDVPPASARAAIVLGAVGVDWREPPPWPRAWERRL